MPLFKWPFSRGDTVKDTRTGKVVGKVQRFDSDGSRVDVRPPGGGLLQRFFGGNLARADSDQGDQGDQTAGNNDAKFRDYDGFC